MSVWIWGGGWPSLCQRVSVWQRSPATAKWILGYHCAMPLLLLQALYKLNSIKTLSIKERKERKVIFIDIHRSSRCPGCERGGNLFGCKSCTKVRVTKKHSESRKAMGFIQTLMLSGLEPYWGQCSGRGPRKWNEICKYEIIMLN